MKANNTTEIKVNKKSLNAACKGIARANNADKKEIKKDRKTLRATIAYIATTDSKECDNLRAFLNLKKNANKTERNNVCAWVQKRYLYVTTKYVVTSNFDAVEVENFGTLPCNKNGRVYNDAIDAIYEIKKTYETTIAKRNEIAKQMRTTRKNRIGKNEYTAENIQRIQNMVNGAPTKMHKQINLGDTIIRK